MARSWQAAVLFILAMPWVAVGIPTPQEDWVEITDDGSNDPVNLAASFGPPANLDVVFGPASSVAPFVNSSAPGDPEGTARQISTNAPPITVNGPASAGPNWGARPGEYLYVWCGVEGRGANDRLVTLDFNRNSPNYGRVISMADVGTSGNEPHHCGLSANKQRMLCGGFFSFMKQQNDIFVFDMSDPANPKFLRATGTPDGAVNDDFIPLADNTFILSQMGNKQGGTPGRVVQVDGEGNILGEYPRAGESLPRGPYNPHGVAVREDLGLFISSDFLGADTALNSFSGSPQLRNTIRVWDLVQMKIRYSYSLPVGTGTMDVKLTHRNGDGIAYVGGTGNGQIWVLNTAQKNAKRVIDLNVDIVPPYFRNQFQVDSQMMQISPDDRFLYIPYASKNDQYTGKSGFYSGVVIYDISNPMAPRLVQNAAYPAYAGPHLGQLYGDRLVTAGYFVNFDSFGKLHLDGDHIVRALNVNGGTGTVSPDNNFQVDFNNLVPGVRLRPHGLATIKQ